MKHLATALSISLAATAFASAGVEALSFDWLSVGRWTVIAFCVVILLRPLCAGLRALVRLRLSVLVAFVLASGIAALNADKTNLLNGSGSQPVGLIVGMLHSVADASVNLRPEASGARLPGDLALRLPDACDVGEAEGFGDLPPVTNLALTAIARCTNSMLSVVSWPPDARPCGDIVDVYAGTNLFGFSWMFGLDVSQCASNALFAVSDEEVSGVDGNDPVNSHTFSSETGDAEYVGYGMCAFPPLNGVSVAVSVGDPSGSLSERWKITPGLRIGCCRHVKFGRM